MISLPAPSQRQATSTPVALAARPWAAHGPPVNSDSRRREVAAQCAGPMQISATATSSARPSPRASPALSSATSGRRQDADGAAKGPRPWRRALTTCGTPLCCKMAVVRGVCRPPCTYHHERTALTQALHAEPRLPGKVTQPHIEAQRLPPAQAARNHQQDNHARRHALTAAQHAPAGGEQHAQIGEEGDAHHRAHRSMADQQAHRTAQHTPPRRAQVIRRAQPAGAKPPSCKRNTARSASCSLCVRPTTVCMVDPPASLADDACSAGSVCRAEPHLHSLAHAAFAASSVCHEKLCAPTLPARRSCPALPARSRPCWKSSRGRCDAPPRVAGPRGTLLAIGAAAARW